MQLGKAASRKCGLRRDEEEAEEDEGEEEDEEGDEDENE